MIKPLTIMLSLMLGCLALGEEPVLQKPATLKKESIDLPDSSIPGALRHIADLFEINVVIPDSLKGRTSIKLREVNWQQAFKVILEPVGYTYIEEGQIIKVIRQKPISVRSEEAALSWADGPWYIVAGIVCFCLLTALCHIALSLGVLRDSSVIARFAPRIVWSVLVLLGGVVALAVYWLIHHSNLKRNERAE